MALTEEFHTETNRTQKTLYTPKEFNTKKYGIFGVILVILLAVIIGFSIYNTPANSFSRQFDLGQRYLEELNYEQAVVAFNKAIEIDPRSADAYLGLADAYIGLGDEEAAYEALEVGYEATGDERIKTRINEMKADMTESEPEILSPIEENDAVADRIDEICDIIYHQGGPNQHTSDGSSHLLTYEQIEAAYRPLAEELEIYLEQEDWKEMDWSLWMCLADVYLHLGEMEKCMETRQKGYEITGWQRLMPDTSEDQNGNVFDEYGRITKNNLGDTYDTYIYGEADRVVMWEYPLDDNAFGQTQYEYDELGRIAGTSNYVSEGWIASSGFAFEYQDDHSVILKSADADDNGHPMYLITYNEYGIHLGWTDVTSAQ